MSMVIFFCNSVENTIYVFDFLVCKIIFDEDLTVLNNLWEFNWKRLILSVYQESVDTKFDFFAVDKVQPPGENCR